ncbi:histidine phosphatase family protein [Microbacterium terricola]|uniref:Phosphatase PhoE n=1 Tax=Microbacterium terricola TaxID=344163 RepID=A0ABM8DY48_9MICO|nr:histidine phosphatase family protein [Microbacterium terricola]UYK38797.1 histidine phosphatase family protein [Microbacterium terricola]BDV30509.1 putative phosphatase PhoE [Microbacterium terricola]
MTILTLVRHGETDWNRDRRVQGSTDIPLNDTGRAQARGAAAALRASLPADLPVVMAASDLARARETAEIIAADLDVAAPALYPDLRERGYGEAEGVDVVECNERWGDWATAVIPGAEPWPAVRARALRGLRAAVRDARRTTAPADAALVIVSHGALIRELIRHATGGEFPLHGERLGNASLHTLRYERDRLSLLSYAGSSL